MNYLPWLIEDYNPTKFNKIKSYAEKLGWKNVRWLNGGVIGFPPDRPWINSFKEYEFVMPLGQLELF